MTEEITQLHPKFRNGVHFLGKDFIMPHQISGMEYGGLAEAFADAVPSDEILEFCQKNHYMLIPGPPEPMSLNDIYARYQDWFDIEHDSSGFTWQADDVPFSRVDTVKPQWLMMKKSIVKGSHRVGWKVQQDMAESPFVIPNVAEVAWALITYARVTRFHLLINEFVRTTSFNSHMGQQILCGMFRKEGLSIMSDYSTPSETGIVIAQRGTYICG